ncbi:MAG: hypothetical protein WD510_03890, partial [Balneolaceae bacterium]
PTINQTPNDKWLVYVPSIRLFVNAPISDEWVVSGALQTDYYAGYRSDLFFSSFNINWMPSERLKFTAGRFATPFGRYDELLLSSENPFVHMPLSHVWNMPVDRKRGYVFSATSYDGVPGQSMVYRRLYSQGLMMSGTTEEETLQYQLSAALTSVSSYTDIGEQNRPALIGRLVWRPVIWNKIGFSLANGPYMVDDPINDILSDEKRAGYLQTIVTAYTEFSYRYYQLLFQYTFNRWDSPWIDPEGELVEDDIANDVAHYMGQFKMRFPFWVGGYGAVRFEKYLPKEITLRSVGITGQPTPDKHRFEFVLGYQVHRNIVLKASYLLSRNEREELKDDVFAVQISAGF